MQDGPAPCFGRMGSQYRFDEGLPEDHCETVCTDAGRADLGDCLPDALGSRRVTGFQFTDAKYPEALPFLGKIDKVEVRGEGPYNEVGLG